MNFSKNLLIVLRNNLLHGGFIVDYLVKSYRFIPLRRGGVYV